MSNYDTNFHRRHSLRLPGYDYAQAGAYFVTICTWDRACLFGDVIDGEWVLSEFGQIVYEEWFMSSSIRNEIELDTFVVMPNHIHGIVWITVEATGRSPLQNALPRGPIPKPLGAFVAGYKSSVTKRINQLHGTPGAPVWQRNYYEHIVRSEQSLQAVRQYVINNPVRWHLDRYHPTS